MKPHKNILESDFINHNTPILKINDPLIKDNGNEQPRSKLRGILIEHI